MKKWMGLLLFAICIFLNSATARADVIWTPDIDLFFSTHEDECEYLMRQYVTNGPNDQVIVYESPLSSKEITTIENGVTIWTAWIYEDDRGVTWVMSTDVGRGWIPTNYLNLVYDYISFEEDHDDEIKTESGQLSGLGNRESIYGWSYPGSVDSEEIVVSADYLPEYSMTYTDANGKVWGYCTYYQGHRNFWMYLDDVKANAKTIYGDNYIVGVVMGENCSTNEVENETDKLIVPNPLRSNKVIGVAVVIVVIATAMILLKMKRIKK